VFGIEYAILFLDAKIRKLTSSITRILEVYKPHSADQTQFYSSSVGLSYLELIFKIKSRMEFSIRLFLNELQKNYFSIHHFWGFDQIMEWDSQIYTT